MPNYDHIPVLGASDPVASVPDYTLNMRKALALPAPVVGKAATSAITLGTSTSWAPIDEVRTPTLQFPNGTPFVNGKLCNLVVALSFGGYYATHAGAGDIRFAARVTSITEVVGVGSAHDWIRVVGQTTGISRVRTVTIPNASDIGAPFAELMYMVTGSPTTRVLAYGYIEMTPLYWLANG